MVYRAPSLMSGNITDGLKCYALISMRIIIHIPIFSSVIATKEAM